MEQIDVLIVGGGPAGLAAAVSLYKQGVTNILLIERESELGGILRQCIHDGFGLTRFGETLSGPEYAKRFIDEIIALNIPYLINTTVLEISDKKVVTFVNSTGIKQYQTKAVILTMGCRERTRGALGIPGERPAGVMTAGVAQAYINLHNKMVGKQIIILGSGDIGMIMARRLTLEGAHVLAVCEIQPYPSGLPRNIIQCLNDYDIPLYLNHTVIEVHGKSRLTGVTIAQVNQNYEPIKGTERQYQCDTLILSVGLIPENELSLGAGVILDKKTKGAVVDEYYQTNIKGIFAAGNVLQVHDLVDSVSIEAERLATGVIKYLQKEMKECLLSINTDPNISYMVPHKFSGMNSVVLSFRIRKPLNNVYISVIQNGDKIAVKKIKRALPAEMVQIKINKDKLKEYGDLEVLIK